MNDEGRKRHWENVYCGKGDREFSWYQNLPSVSLELVELAGIRSDAAVIDIGGGTSFFSECLIEKGIGDISVLDLSQSALEESKRRLGLRGKGVCWLVADITTWRPANQPATAPVPAPIIIPAKNESPPTRRSIPAPMLAPQAAP